MANIFIEESVYQGTSSACIVDLTPPTFAGITALAVQSRGQIRASWAAATDASPPIRYEVYIQASTATGLFNVANIIAITDKLQYDTFVMPDGSFLVNGTTYFVGIRAIDGVSNRDSNTVSMNVISTGVSVSADVYEVDGAFTINSSNQFQGTIWALKNSILAKTGNAVMGTASYQVYDKAGAAVPGMGASGITADANGQYKITPVASSLATKLEHYMVLVTVNVDSANRQGYVKLIEPVPEYDLAGAFSLNNSNQLVGTYWVMADGEQISNAARLGTSAYQIYDMNGSAVVGMSGSGLTADANGFYKITPITSLLVAGLANYYVKITTTVDNIARSHVLPILGQIPEYEVRGQFSINALNQFQATLWATTDDQVKMGAGLGVANYTVYDSAGNPVSGMTQSGISADGNGRFQITPVTAALLTDLTHYSVKIGIVVDGVERISYRGFTLLGN